MRYLFALLLALATLPLVACTQECTTPADCGDGFVCTESGTCQEIACTSSLDCPIESWCNDVGQCEAGCLNDRDCLPSSRCDQEQKECIPQGCRTSALDCEFGQFCNAVSGQCVDAGGFYCNECTTSADCGSSNNVCVGLGGQGTYCGVDCSGGQECPAGYSCGRVRTIGDVTVSFVCIAACWEY